jgi:hypothetical protein
MAYEFHVQTPCVASKTGQCVHCGHWTAEALLYQHQLYPFHHAHVEELSHAQRCALFQKVLAAAKAEAAEAA